MVATIDGIALWAEERCVFQVKPVQSPGVLLFDCRTKFRELLAGHGWVEIAGKAGAPDVSGRLAAEQSDVSSFLIAGPARKASFCNVGLVLQGRR